MRQNILIAIASALCCINSLKASEIRVTVNEEIHTPEMAMNSVNALENPHVVLWYSGESGLTAEGAQFYNTEILSRLTTPGKFLLYDLAAWESLRKKKVATDVKSRTAQTIERSAHDRITPIHSADFFSYLKKEDRAPVIQHINQVILKKHELYTNSESRKTNGILIKEKLPHATLSAIQDLDTAHAYSALQYLEGLFLINQIISSAPSASNVVFLLPNDEYKYYTAPDLAQDIKTVLQTDSLQHSVNVQFMCFKFGSSISERPYILRGKKVTTQNVLDFIPPKKLG